MRMRDMGITRRGLIGGAGALAALVAGGCASAPASRGSAAGAKGFAASSAEPVRVRMGTMVTEDFLPGWAAGDRGLFPSSVAVEISTFQSAQELSTALAAGEIDMAMTDPQVSASLAAGGTDVRLLWIALGATPAQGRFGIQVGPDSKIGSVEALRGASIGVGSNTVPEYVMDKLLEAAGITDADFKKEEVKKMPVRFQMMISGKTDAAALPASLLALGEAQGCKTIVDDTKGENLSQSVIIARTAFADEHADAVDAVRKGWDAAAGQIDDDPESFRRLLVEKANLAEPLKESYKVPEYPVGVAPTSDEVQPQLDWMLEKGYLKQALSFDGKTGAFEA